jgi:acylphosphatase
MKKECRLIHLSIVNKNIASRFLIMQQAYKYNIKGYVEKINDDTMFIHAEGDSELVKYFIQWCGSFQLSKEKCLSLESAPVRNYTSFEIVSTHKIH